MSSMDTELLRLYKDDKLYHGSRYKVYQGNKTMDEYLGNPDYEKYVNYKSISEPILINEAIKNCDEYTYGSITNEGKTYYFFVDHISTDAYYKTTIEYTVDWWSTNWDQIHCTKAHITRAPTKPGYMEQPFTPIGTSVQTTPITDKFIIMATYIPSTKKSEQVGNEEVISQKDSYISYILMEGTSENLQKVEQGIWYQELQIPGADVKDCFIVPFLEMSDFMGGLYTPPIFRINIDKDKDDFRPYKWESNGPLLNEFIDTYPCFTVEKKNVYKTPDAFTGNEIVYNEFTGKYYQVQWVTWEDPPVWITQPSQWLLVEVDPDDVFYGIASQFYIY